MSVLAVRSGYIRDGELRGSDTSVDTLTLVPASGSGRVGSSYSLVATLKDDAGTPRAGVTLTFTVTGANPQTTTGVTDALGQVTFTYTGTTAGTDTVTVEVGGDYEALIVADGPEVYYRFPDTTTPIPDLSGNGNVGHPGGTYTQGVAGPIDATDEAILLGTGAFGEVSLDSLIAGDDLSNKESWEFWLYRTAAAAVAQPIIVEGANGHVSTILFDDINGKGIGIRNTDNTVRIVAPTAPALDTWEHYVIVHDRANSMAYVYRDGALVASGAFSDAIKGCFRIGSDSDAPSTTYWTGRIDEFAYYHRALTEAEIAEHYETATGETETATVEWSVVGSGMIGRRTARLVP